MLTIHAGLMLLMLAGRTSGEPVTHGMIVVTTKLIAEQSVKLADFVAEKEKRGFTVLVATEDDYGGVNTVGPQRAALIREWLKTMHGPYTYLLLVGDSHPRYGDVPMWVVWPRHQMPADSCAGFAVNCQSHETDYLYADLTGNWDLNGNGRLGETGLDEGPGGVDTTVELFVGRMGVYNQDLRSLDRVLDNAIKYMNQEGEQLAYRKKVLLPASFFYFRGQPLGGMHFTADVDGAEISEWFIHNAVDALPGFTVTRMYEQAGVAPSRFPSDVALTRDNLKQQWREGQGFVFWFGHGLEKEVARTIWSRDTNGDGQASQDELTNELFIHSSDAPSLDSSRPGFVVAVSCEVGSMETPGNLSNSLLVNNATIGMIGSTSVTPGSATNWADPDATLSTREGGADNIGILFFQALVSGTSGAQAFFEAKQTCTTPRDPENLSGLTMLNYVGDPSLTLNSSAADISTPPPSPKPDEPVDNQDSKPFGCSATASHADWMALGAWLLWTLRRKQARHKSAS